KARGPKARSLATVSTSSRARHLLSLIEAKFSARYSLLSKLPFISVFTSQYSPIRAKFSHHHAEFHGAVILLRHRGIGHAQAVIGIFISIFPGIFIQSKSRQRHPCNHHKYWSWQCRAGHCY